jgi:hypothetical protein
VSPEAETIGAIHRSAAPDSGLLRDPILARIGAAHGCSAFAVVMARTIRSRKVIAISESGAWRT